MRKRIKTKKVKTSEECNKKDWKMIIIIIIITTNNNDINNDYNDSNRKGKALKVATKKTLKIIRYFLPDFWNVTALKSLQFRFQKSIKSLLLQLFPFLLLLSLYRNHYYCFFILILFIWLYFQFIFNPSLVCIIILLFLYFLSFYLVRILSSFLFHSSSFFYVFAIFIRFALQRSPLWASSTCHYFQFYPYWPFKNHPRRTPRSSEPSAKLKSLLPLLLYTLLLSTLRYFIRTFNGSPFPEPHEGLRYTHF